MCGPGDAPQTIATTSGRATADFEIKIAEAGSGADLPGGTGHEGDQPVTGAPAATGHEGDQPAAERTGEILLRGPNGMLGYLDDPAPTAEAIDSRRLPPTPD